MHTKSKYIKVNWFLWRVKAALGINFLLSLLLSEHLVFQKTLSFHCFLYLYSNWKQYTVYNQRQEVQDIWKDILKQVTSDSSVCFSPRNWKVNLSIILKSDMVIIWACVNSWREKVIFFIFMQSKYTRGLSSKQPWLYNFLGLFSLFYDKFSYLCCAILPQFRKNSFMHVP